jgi:hypothetical protein
MHDLAKAAGLDISADEKTLDIAITKIHTAMHDWVMGERFKEKAMRRRRALDWAETLAIWVEDGIKILGGSATKHGWVKEDPALITGIALLMRALPRVDADNPDTTDRANYDIQRRLAAALRQAGIEDPAQAPTFNAEPSLEAPEDPTEFQLWWTERYPTGLTDSVMKRLLGILLGSLGARRVLEPGLKQYVSNLPARHSKDIDRQTLIWQLSDCFEQLHKPGYTIITPNPVSHPSAPPKGPALDWTRGLFRLFADRAEAKADGSSAFPEFRELAIWGKRPHALADLIKKRPTRRRREIRGN